ncbi:MAG: hypothetical protein CMQ45_07540 [Gammaproteobacteria bacterium]|nr:hypothetical protein [Gammaproteobacteria bacterium]
MESLRRVLLMLRQVRKLYWNFLSDAARTRAAATFEESMWTLMMCADRLSNKKIFFDAYRDLAPNRRALDQLLRVLNEGLKVRRPNPV